MLILKCRARLAEAEAKLMIQWYGTIVLLDVTVRDDPVHWTEQLESFFDEGVR